MRGTSAILRTGQRSAPSALRGAVAALLLASACAGCGGSRYASRWDGRRGYDGQGDYGYDVAASKAEARAYRGRAARSYPAPGTPDDPWGPYVREAAQRFGVPELWIREVMQQESGSHLYDSSGSLVTSPVGAMGLMQVMPGTYDGLRQRYRLGDDPYDPHNNILAGAAYIREMYDRYGSPAFLAAYNAGPDRLDAYLSDGTPLPDETVSYLASVAPRIGGSARDSGPLAVFAGQSAVPGYSPDRAYAGGGISQAVGYAPDVGDDDAASRAFDGGGLVTASAPTGVLTGRSPASPAVIAGRAPVSPAVIVSAYGAGGAWGIQVGAYSNPSQSVAAIELARGRVRDLLGGSQPEITPVQRGATLYRARLVGLSPETAAAACARLTAAGVDCLTVPPRP